MAVSTCCREHSRRFGLVVQAALVFLRFPDCSFTARWPFIWQGGTGTHTVVNKFLLLLRFTNWQCEVRLKFPVVILYIFLLCLTFYFLPYFFVRLQWRPLYNPVNWFLEKFNQAIDIYAIYLLTINKNTQKKIISVLIYKQLLRNLFSTD